MDVQEAKAKFSGPMVSVATPFTPDYDLDLDALQGNISFMVERGLREGQGVLLVAAAGGEFPMLNMQERKDVIKASVEAAEGAVPIAASIQFNGTREVIDLANAGLEDGLALGQLSSPYYYPPPDEDIYTFYRDVSEASDLPIMIYNNWWNTLNMNVEMVARLAELETIVALKWSAPSFTQYTQGLHRFADRFAIIDNENQLVWPHMMGAVGFITHVGNFWPEYTIEIWDLLRQRNYDGVIPKLAAFQWHWQKWVGKVVQETEGEGPFIKAAMDEARLKAGPPRPPGRSVSQELREELRQLFDDAGVPRAEA